MSISDNIRFLARSGKSVSEIAQELGIRYQHAYNVLKRSEAAGTVTKIFTERSRISPKPCPPEKPKLNISTLVTAGFEYSARWLVNELGTIKVDRALPKKPGVYAFCKQETVVYVGVATMGLAKRIYFYGRPGITQRTSQRLNEIIRAELQQKRIVDIYTAIPHDFDWNGLPVDGCIGLELGLIKKYSLPWNIRSAGNRPEIVAAVADGL